LGGFAGSLPLSSLFGVLWLPLDFDFFLLVPNDLDCLGGEPDPLPFPASLGFDLENGGPFPFPEPLGFDLGDAELPFPFPIMLCFDLDAGEEPFPLPSLLGYDFENENEPLPLPGTPRFDFEDGNEPLPTLLLLGFLPCPLPPWPAGA
jgi:hypothetical protein